MSVYGAAHTLVGSAAMGATLRRAREAEALVQTLGEINSGLRLEIMRLQRENLELQYALDRARELCNG